MISYLHDTITSRTHLLFARSHCNINTHLPLGRKPHINVTFDSAKKEGGNDPAKRVQNLRFELLRGGGVKIEPPEEIGGGAEDIRKKEVHQGP